MISRRNKQTDLVGSKVYVAPTLSQFLASNRAEHVRIAYVEREIEGGLSTTSEPAYLIRYLSNNMTAIVIKSQLFTSRISALRRYSRVMAQANEDSRC